MFVLVFAWPLAMVLDITRTMDKQYKHNRRQGTSRDTHKNMKRVKQHSEHHETNTPNPEHCEPANFHMCFLVYSPTHAHGIAIGATTLVLIGKEKRLPQRWPGQAPAPCVICLRQVL